MKAVSTALFNYIDDIIDMFFDDEDICTVTNKISYFIILFFSFMTSERLNAEIQVQIGQAVPPLSSYWIEKVVDEILKL